MTQTPDSKLLEELEEFLGLTNIETAQVLGVSYSTYMKWRTGSRTMPAIGHRCVALVYAMVRAGMPPPMK